MLCLAAVGAALLGVQPAAAQDLRFGGFVRLDRRITLADSVRFADFYSVFRPELSASFEGRAEIVMSLDMRFHDFPDAQSTTELEDADRHFPNSVTVWEAFAHVPEFLVEPLDLTVGKQRIQWGTADGLSPTDRFNAYDLSDLTDFTARLPVWAVRVEYYATPGWKIEGVWTPTAHGPLLPRGMEGLFAAGVGSVSGSVRSWQRHFEPPSRAFRNSQLGLKVAGRVTGVDLSVSYFRGPDAVPAIRKVAFMSPDTSASAPTFDAHVWSVLPHSQVLGADVATEWRGVGIWAEGAVVFPEEIVVVTDVITRSDSVRDRVTATEERPYATWTIGGDYRFHGGWYLNLQWAHGIFLERGAGQLHDYLTGKLQYRLLRETVRVSLEGVVEVAQWSEWSDHAGYAMYPQIEYLPVDNLAVAVGGLFAGGRGGALFGRLEDVDQLYLRVKASF
ncbi:MAG TPA: DUF1302 family protein [Longimicrobiales bacterium]|nr:DUF1302 family protein [Longimicrobiales bacterium]